jgi:hypothetical protein
MGAFISTIFKPIGNFASAFWTALIGPKPVVPDPIQMMNEVARKAAEEATKATAEAVAKAAEEVTKKAAEEVMKKATKEAVKAAPKDQCTHCKGTGINQKKDDQNCPHCKGKGRKPKPQMTRPEGTKTKGGAGSGAEKSQGYQGKSEFYIEGYDKMTPEQKRAAKQAKWDEIQASKARKALPVMDVSTSWGDQVFDERQGAAL